MAEILTGGTSPARSSARILARVLLCCPRMQRITSALLLPSLAAYGMFNKITGTTPSADINYTRHSKLKYGVDAIYSFSPMVACAFRGDVVNPNMSDSAQSFYSLSPRFIFRSEFVTHEMITLQYSRYIYGGGYTDPTRVDELIPWPYGANGNYSIRVLGGHPDENVVTLSASMWW
jgi:hypothetical protein